jgi:hypothetical protein
VNPPGIQHAAHPETRKGLPSASAAAQWFPPPGEPLCPPHAAHLRSASPTSTLDALDYGTQSAAQSDALTRIAKSF